jgi:TRAP-type C4-dicarboxylate transport system substrate-binding protein
MHSMVALPVLACTVLALVGSALAQPATPAAELRVSVAAGPAMPLGRAAQRWAELLSEGAVAGPARLFPGATLAARDASRELQALKDGGSDLAVGSALQWSSQVPGLGVFALPWIAPEPGGLLALAEDDALFEALEDRLEAFGVVLVDLAPLGHREIATVERAVRAPGDLAGLRLRTIAAPLVQDLFVALGAKPQPMSFREAQAAFASGALDGQEGPPSALAAARAGASGQKHLTDWGAVGDTMVFAVRKSLWDGWTESQREAVRSAATRAVAEADAAGREARALQELAASGLALVRITPAGHAAFREAVREMDARWRGVVGADLVQLAESALQKAAPARK